MAMKRLTRNEARRIAAKRPSEGARGRLTGYHRAMPDPKLNDVDFHEETDSPSYADDRNFYKVEKFDAGLDEGRQPALCGQ